MKNKFNFTQKKLEALPLPEAGKRTAYRDEKKSGLVLVVYPTGNKVFQLYKKFQSRPVRIKLGTFPEMGVEEARREATIKDGELARGTNPNVEKHKIRNEMTFKELFHDYMERYSKLQKKSWQYDEREVNKFLSHWFNRKINSIEKYEVVRLQERIFKEKAKDRFVQPKELPLLFKAAENEHNEVARDFVFVALLTGARKTNTLQMQWRDVDLVHARWRIPETKNGEPQTVHLSDTVLERLKERKLASNDSKWVFPSDSEAGYLADPKKAWTRIRQYATILLWEQSEHLKKIIDNTKENLGEYYDVGTLFRAVQKKAEAQDLELPEGLTDLRLHDLRRTFGSYQAITGASMQVIGKTLGHKFMDSTKVYAHLIDDPIKDSVNKATDAMLNFGIGDSKDGE